eukprot:scaffold38318_cov61-Phaeocystis_antarctica.AAC.3
MARVRARAALCQEKVGSACSAFGVFGLGLWPGLGLGRLSVRSTLAQPAQPSAPAGSPEAAFSARSSLRLPRASASLGLSAGRPHRARFRHGRGLRRSHSDPDPSPTTNQAWLAADHTHGAVCAALASTFEYKRYKNRATPLGLWTRTSLYLRPARPFRSHPSYTAVGADLVQVVNEVSSRAVGDAPSRVETECRLRGEWASREHRVK